MKVILNESEIDLETFCEIPDNDKFLKELDNIVIQFIDGEMHEVSRNKKI